MSNGLFISHLQTINYISYFSTSNILFSKFEHILVFNLRYRQKEHNRLKGWPFKQLYMHIYFFEWIGQKHGKLIEMLLKSINVYGKTMKKKDCSYTTLLRRQNCWVQIRTTRCTDDKCVFCDFGFRISNVSIWQLVLISEQNESKHM